MQLGHFQGNMSCSYFVSAMKLLLNGCIPQHLSREEYPRGPAGGICVAWCGIESALIRDDEREGEKIWDVLSVCQFKPGK